MFPSSDSEETTKCARTLTKKNAASTFREELFVYSEDHRQKADWGGKNGTISVN